MRATGKGPSPGKLCRDLIHIVATMYSVGYSDNKVLYWLQG